MPDIGREIQSIVKDAVDRSHPLLIQGSGSKAFYGRKSEGRLLDTSGHSGIVDYEPTEMVVTARCGTPLREIEKTLDEQGQMLGFEPPRFSADATLGGTVAAGLSGPRRPFSGSVRDFVLGCRLINGRGEILGFGGTVMKNVAGYDVSRLTAGSLGTLGVILDVSIKVVPRPEKELTLRQEMNACDAIEKMNQWLTRPIPVSGLSWYRDAVYIRLSGGSHAVEKAAMDLGGDAVPSNERFWTDLRDQTLPFFDQDRPLWRISLQPSTPPVQLTGEWIYDWAGGQRWYRSENPDEALFQLAGAAAGHATLFRAKDRRQAVFQPLPDSLARLHRRLKDAFDPQRIFNRGRMYPEW